MAHVVVLSRYGSLGPSVMGWEMVLVGVERAERARLGVKLTGGVGGVLKVIVN